MKFHRACLVAVLLALPACFDPIVGSKCAEGYSLCGNRCVVAGTCTVVDAAAEAAPIDGDRSVDTTAVNVETTDAGESSGDDVAVLADDGGAIDESVPRAEVGGVLDTSQEGIPDGGAFVADSADVAVTNDVPLADDVPPVDDLPITPPILDDAAVDQGAIDQVTTDETPISLDDGGAAVVGMDAEEGEVATAIDADQGEAGPLVCTDSTVICNNQCVDLTADPENCGTCNNICASGVCNESTCLVCTAEEMVCGRQCINVFVDPDNCGGCGIPCASGLCSSGVCEAAGTGRTIVIGHDYLHNRPAMNRILGNAVFLWPVNPVRVLVYEGAANGTAIAGADGAIAQVAAATGRQWVRTPVTATDVPSALASTNVFLIYGQESADDATLNQFGTDWQSALFAFVNAGGTLIVLDGAYEANAGTSQIVFKAGVFKVARNVSVTNGVCNVVARGDALASGLPRTYLCEQNSTNLTVTDLAVAAITSVVEVSGQSVVVHKVF
jgi:hypothetical protein